MEDSIKIIPLGGFDKIGMNMTLIESENSIIAIDCGMSFPPNNLPGVAAIIPDISYIKENKDKFKGFISANYVINEWLDAPYDKYHPTKKNRP